MTNLYKAFGLKGEEREGSEGNLYDAFGARSPAPQTNSQWDEDRPPLTREEYYREFNQRTQNESQGAQPAKVESSDSIGDNMLDVAGEFAAAGNRSLTSLLDTVPQAINAGAYYAGSDKRIPTVTDLLAPTGIRGGFMEPGLARDLVQGAGGATVAAGGVVPVTRSATAGSSVAADLLGFGSSQNSPLVAAGMLTEDAARSAGRTLASTARATGETALNVAGAPAALDGFPDYLSAARRGINQARATPEQRLDLARKTGDVTTFPLRMDEAGNVFKDAAQTESAKQGLRKGIVTMVNAAPERAKANMRGMLDIVERGTKNELYAANNRPLDLVGESLAARTRTLAVANRQAGRMIEREADNLKKSGAMVDFRPAIDAMMDDLEGMGIRFNAAARQIDFSGSDIEGIPKAQQEITKMIERLYNSGKAATAYDGHRMKRWLDEQIAWGKAGEGLTGRVENVLKGLRRGLDDILDSEFPDYNRANTMYAETIGALQSLQESVGKRIDLTGVTAATGLGQISRRLRGNLVSRPQLVSAIAEVDDVTRKVLTGQYAGTNVVPYKPEDIASAYRMTVDDLDDSLQAQVAFAAQLDDVFGTFAVNSNLGELQRAQEYGQRAAELVEGKPLTHTIIDAGRTFVNERRGINEENAMKAFRDLLK